MGLLTYFMCIVKFPRHCPTSTMYTCIVVLDSIRYGMCFPVRMVEWFVYIYPTHLISGTFEFKCVKNSKHRKCVSLVLRLYLRSLTPYPNPKPINPMVNHSGILFKSHFWNTHQHQMFLCLKYLFLPNCDHNDLYDILCVVLFLCLKPKLDILKTSWLAASVDLIGNIVHCPRIAFIIDVMVLYIYTLPMPMFVKVHTSCCTSVNHSFLQFWAY